MHLFRRLVVNAVRPEWPQVIDTIMKTVASYFASNQDSALYIIFNLLFCIFCVCIAIATHEIKVLQNHATLNSDSVLGCTP